MRAQYQPGIESCEEALKRDPDNLLTIFNLSLAYEHIGDYAQALRWVKAGLQIEPREMTFQKLEFRLRVMNNVQRVRELAGKLAFWSRKS